MWRADVQVLAELFVVLNIIVAVKAVGVHAGLGFLKPPTITYLWSNAHGFASSPQANNFTLGDGNIGS